MALCTAVMMLGLAQPSAQATAPATRAEIRWRATPDEALAEAKRTGKAAAFYFYADWCEFSKRLNAEVLNRPEVVRLFDRFVPCRIECESQRSLMRRFRVAGFPVLIFFDGEGRRLDELAGTAAVDSTQPAEDYARKLQDCTDTIYERAGWEKRAASNPRDAEAAARLALLTANRQEFALAAKYVDLAAAADAGDARGICRKVYWILAEHAADAHDSPTALVWYERELAVARTEADQAEARCGIAERCYALGRLERALAEFKKVQKLPGASVEQVQKASRMVERLEQMRTN